MSAIGTKQTSRCSLDVRGAFIRLVARCQYCLKSHSNVFMHEKSALMKAGDYPKFKNDNATPEIRIGAKEFKCIGVSPPQDHPHVYLEMGESDSILCPYCATRFSFDDTLSSNEADPPGCLFVDEYNEQ